MYVCLCADKTEDEIAEVVQNGIEDIDSLMDELGVCVGCGCCRRMVERMLPTTTNLS